MRIILFSIIGFLSFLGACKSKPVPTGQPSQATGKAYSHLAQFSVYDYTTKAPIQKAVVLNPLGEELGYTDYTGSLALNVPPNTSDFYTIKAEGFNPMNIRLTQADKKKGEYEVFLPASEIGYSRNNSELTADASNDMVKVYVKQDPGFQTALEGGVTRAHTGIDRGIRRRLDQIGAAWTFNGIDPVA